MYTSDPAILACGNCAEPPAGAPLLWNPARAQGEIAGLNAFERKAAIAPEPAVIHLKVRGEPLFSCSRPGPAPVKARKISSGEGGALLALVIDEGGSIAAATMVGDARGASLLERAIRDGAPLPPELAAADDPSRILEHLRRAAEGSRERGGWVCRMCGFTGEGDDPPELCPVCGVGKDQFQAA
jgi:NAD(P)H-nitrite reductase large subunit